MTKTIAIIAWLLTAVLPCAGQYWGSRQTFVKPIEVKVWKDGECYLWVSADSVMIYPDNTIKCYYVPGDTIRILNDGFYPDTTIVKVSN